MIRPWLSIGTRDDVRNPGALAAAGIQSVLQLATTVQMPGFVSKELGVDDAKPLPGFLIREGVDFIAEQKAAGHSVLVCCSGGFSRSVTFAIAALREEEGISLAHALEAVRAVHPEAQPHPELWESLCAYYQEPLPAATRRDVRGRRSWG